MSQTVLIGGGSGLIGSRLSNLLKKRGYEVIHLSRQKKLDKDFPAYAWDLDKMTIDLEAIQKADFVINLAGAGIADKPWTAARKKLIIDSRVKSNQLLFKSFKLAKHKPKAFISASGIGYYGDSGEELVDENSQPGSGFLSESVKIWEKSIEKDLDKDIRRVALRIGLVLSTRGGALPPMMLPLRFFLGIYFGKGRQWYSWIHIDDLCQSFIWAIEKENINGVYNAVGPNSLRNKAVIRAFGKARGLPFLLLPAPAFALKLFLGELSQTVLISTKVSCEKLSQTGFRFQFPELDEAVKDLIKRKI